MERMELMHAPSIDFTTSRMSLNQATVRRTALPTALEAISRAGIHSVGLWREPVMAVGIPVVAQIISDIGLRVSSFCTGEFSVAPTFDTRAEALRDARRGLDEAAELGSPALVLRGGGLPQDSRDLRGAQHAVAHALNELEEHAVARGVTLALEPLHPMFTADRGVITTVLQALEIVEELDSPAIGLAIDTYNCWWDPQLPALIERAANRIAVVQVADWVTPLAADPLLSRGMMGDGHISFSPIVDALQKAGYRGDIEVEIFNEKLWNSDPDWVISLARERFHQHVVPPSI